MEPYGEPYSEPHAGPGAEPDSEYGLPEFRQSIADLMQLLSQENEAVLAGRFEGLHEIAPRKMKLAAAVEQFVRTNAHEIDEPLRIEIAAMQRACVHNGRILKAAYNGSLSAQNRLVELATRQSEVGAYGANGHAIKSSESVISREKTV